MQLKENNELKSNEKSKKKNNSSNSKVCLAVIHTQKH